MRNFYVISEKLRKHIFCILEVAEVEIRIQHPGNINNN